MIVVTHPAETEDAPKVTLNAEKRPYVRDVLRNDLQNRSE